MRVLTGKTLILATHNLGKVREFEALMAPFDITVESAKDRGLDEPKETGKTFEENAYIKAFAAASATLLPALADDSGLCVDALDGAPGVYTADYATKPDGSRDFLWAMEKLEKALRAVGATTNEQRSARFICVLCLAWPDGYAESFRGEIAGHLVWPPQGEDGFGFDPVFRPYGHDRTFGQLTAEAKHSWSPGGQSALSHRARAFAKFAEAKLSIPT